MINEVTSARKFQQKINQIIFLGVLLILVVLSGCHNTSEFNGDIAYKHVEYQLELGPRTPGSSSHLEISRYIKTTLKDHGWQVEFQITTWKGKSIRNIFAKKGEGDPVVLLGAHYDSRLFADRDSQEELRSQPVPGANDGASGVAVLLELGRVIPDDLDKEIWLVFFDAEDQGEIEGWDWIYGSEAFAASLTTYPDKVVIVDMIGDANLNIHFEQNSNNSLSTEIWSVAADLGYDDYFLPMYKYSILDDHTPFLRLGIPSIDIIDFDYPAWHTTGDTIDQISAQSLEIVGKTLYTWLIMD